MKILVDENIPAITFEALQKPGHDALDIRGTPKEGFADEKLWLLTPPKSRLLITTDKGLLIIEMNPPRYSCNSSS